jgi:hypothetical protein
LPRADPPANGATDLAIAVAAGEPDIARTNGLAVIDKLKSQGVEWRRDERHHHVGESWHVRLPESAHEAGGKIEGPVNSDVLARQMRRFIYRGYDLTNGATELAVTVVERETLLA